MIRPLMWMLIFLGSTAAQDVIGALDIARQSALLAGKQDIASANEKLDSALQMVQDMTNSQGIGNDCYCSDISFLHFPN